MLDEQAPETEVEVEAAGTQQVSVPYPFSQYVCPQCGRTIHHRDIQTLGRPPQMFEQLNLVLRCPHCRYVFSPKTTKPIGGLITLGAEDASVQQPDGSYVCPGCGQPVPPARVKVMRRPPKHAEHLNVVLRCGLCTYVFSPRPTGRRIAR